MSKGLCFALLTAALFSLTLIPTSAWAQTSGTILSYTVQASSSGGYDYDFELVAGAAQTSVAWLIFGDSGPSGPAAAQALGNGSSGQVGVTMTSSVPGPWTSLGSSSGGHNGPSFSYVLDPWYPAGAGSSLIWSVNAPNLVSPETLY